ncbi:hypothetical protein DPMN_011837 [Dreissena polymorpha]|uniref:Uncharacterized protein n=1 Tax=Dreissena polymorpha TaxID=45954 RepID=A0A9D4N4V6_DREPO|nr:hypothetical protein DPMN_011837 [Dreissena polymorpha]
MDRNVSSDFTSKFSERTDADTLWSNFAEFCTTAIDSNDKVKKNNFIKIQSI